MAGFEIWTGRSLLTVAWPLTAAILILIEDLPFSSLVPVLLGVAGSFFLYFRWGLSTPALLLGPYLLGIALGIVWLVTLASAISEDFASARRRRLYTALEINEVLRDFLLGVICGGILIAVSF